MNARRRERRQNVCLWKMSFPCFSSVSSRVYFLLLLLLLLPRFPFLRFHPCSDDTLPDWCWLDDVSSPHEPHTVGILLLIIHVQCLLMQREPDSSSSSFSSEVSVGWCVRDRDNGLFFCRCVCRCQKNDDDEREITKKFQVSVDFSLSPAPHTTSIVINRYLTPGHIFFLPLVRFCLCRKVASKLSFYILYLSFISA